MVDKIYVVEYPDLGIKQEKLLIDHSIYLEYLALPYETKEEQSYAKKWFKSRTKGKEWFTERSPYFEAISSRKYNCNLKESINIKVYLKYYMNYQEKVLEFQLTAGEDFTKGLTPLREALLREEIQELENAIKANDRVEILDALCDTKYVNGGNANYTDSKLDDFLEEAYYGGLDKDVNLLLDELKEIDVEYFHSINGAVYDLAFAFNFTLENFKTALDRVHASNMSKFCNTEQEAVESVISYKEQGIDVYSKQVGEKWVIYRLSDNKVLKSKYYHRVDLTDLV